MHIDGRLVGAGRAVEFVDVDPVIAFGPGIGNADKTCGIPFVPRLPMGNEQRVNRIAYPIYDLYRPSDNRAQSSFSMLLPSTGFASAMHCVPAGIRKATKDESR